MIKLISFDIGGTLVNTSDNKNIVCGFYMELNKILNEHHISSESAIQCLRLKNFSIESYCEYIGLDCVIQISEVVSSYKTKHVLYDDVIGTLNRLKTNYKLITISNAVSIKNIPLVEYDINHYFDLELYSYNFNSLKPNKKMFEYAEKALRLKPEECLHIGDSKNDVTGAKNVGWKSIFLDRTGNCTYGAVSPDYIIQSLKGISEVLRSLYGISK